MTGKYESLLPEILPEPSLGNGRYVAGIRDALNWLDEHPDQVPGRTITASEFDEAVESCITEDATVPPHTFAARLGVVCVPDPDPEPTIADAELEIEKIKLDERNKFIDELLKDAENEAWIARMGDDEDRLRVAEYLAEYLSQIDVETGERTL